MGILKKIAWMIAAGPIMIVTALITLVVGAVYLVLGGIAACFFFWMCFWGLHWAFTHDPQSAYYCAIAFAGCAIPGSIITLLTFALGSGVKGTVTGLAKREVGNRHRAHIAVPAIRPKPARPNLHVVN
jgi:hypothetical protein